MQGVPATEAVCVLVECPMTFLGIANSNQKKTKSKTATRLTADVFVKCNHHKSSLVQRWYSVLLLTFFAINADWEIHFSNIKV